MPRELMRYLMNAQANDGSPGGAPAGGQGTGTPAAPQANGDVAAAVADQLKTLAPAIAQQVNDAVFANLRRAGVLGGGGQPGRQPGGAGDPPAPQQQQQGQPQPQPAGGDVRALIARERAFTRAVNGAKLSDGQLARMERAFEAEQPEDVAGWVKSYLTDFGLAPQASGANPNASNNAAGAGGARPPQNRPPPVSDGGAPGANASGDYDGQAWNMPQADIDALVAEKGMLGASRHIRQMVKRDMRGTRILLPGRSR